MSKYVNKIIKRKRQEKEKLKAKSAVSRERNKRKGVEYINYKSFYKWKEAIERAQKQETLQIRIESTSLQLYNFTKLQILHYIFQIYNL